MKLDRWLSVPQAARIASDASVATGGGPISTERMRRRLKRLQSRHPGTLIRNYAGSGYGARFEVSTEALYALMRPGPAVMGAEIEAMQARLTEALDKLEALRRLFRQRSREWYRRLQTLESQARANENEQKMQPTSNGAAQQLRPNGSGRNHGQSGTT